MHGIYKTHKVGFTLLELLVVIALIGIMSAIIVPTIGRKNAHQERQAFIAKLNALTSLGWQQALIQHTAARISIDAKRHTVTLEQPQGLTHKTTISWPEQLEIKQFFIEGKLEEGMSRAGKGEKIAWFFIVPEGMAQDIIINCVDTKDTKDDKPRPCSLVLNPFTAQFKEYDTFQTSQT